MTDTSDYSDSNVDDDTPLLRHRANAAPNVSKVCTDGLPSSTPPFRPILIDERSKNDPAFVPEQFRRYGGEREPSVPWRSVLLGAFLLVMGTFSLVMLASDVWRGYDGEKGEVEAKLAAWKRDGGEGKPPTFHSRSERFWPLLIAGLIAFIPGSYVVGLALCAFLNIMDCTYNDIPS